MSSSTNKKVLVLRFQREMLAGFVHPQTFQTATGIEMLTRDGNILTVPYEEVKVVCFVQDFEEQVPALDNLKFTSRPKSAGLWVRVIFRDGTHLDGLLPNNLLKLEPFGYMLTPPAPKESPQRVFLPKAALREILVLAVVGSGLHTKKKSPDARQASIFE